MGCFSSKELGGSKAAEASKPTAQGANGASAQHQSAPNHFKPAATPVYDQQPAAYAPHAAAGAGDAGVASTPVTDDQSLRQVPTQQEYVDQGPAAKNLESDMDAEAQHTANAAAAFGNGNGQDAANPYALPSRQRTSPKPADRPRWGSTPAAAAAQARRTGSGRVSSPGQASVGSVQSTPRRRTDSDATNGGFGGHAASPASPSFMAATRSSSMKSRTGSPVILSADRQGRKPYGLLQETTTA